jgi:hypothetical protein
MYTSRRSFPEEDCAHLHHRKTITILSRSSENTSENSKSSLKKGAKSAKWKLAQDVEFTPKMHCGSSGNGSCHYSNGDIAQNTRAATWWRIAKIGMEWQRPIAYV